MDNIIGFIAQYLYIDFIVTAFIYVIVVYRNRLIELGMAFFTIGGLTYLLSKVACPGSCWLPTPSG